MMMITPRQRVSPFLNLSEDVEQGIGDALNFLEDSFETTNILPSTRIGLTPSQYTPLNNIDRSVEYNSKKKRVEFSPWTKYLSAPNHQDQNSENPQLLKLLPSTRPTKFVKSILKSHNNSSPLRESDHNIIRDYVSPSQKIDTFGGMLDTVVEQLASECTDLRLDAYIVFQGALGAFNYNVDRDVLSRKSKLLQSFLKRDITASAGTSAIENQLTIQALKTLMVLLRNVVFQDSVEDCFAAFLLDRSIAVLTDQLASKQIVTHHLQVLALQRFSRKIMNGDRAERILSALIDIEKRCRGSNVIGARLLIYQRLIAQNKPIMVARVSEWIVHLFDGVFCSAKEVRNRSIDIGVNIALLLSGNSHCIRAVLDLFDRDHGAGVKYATYITNNLSERLANVEETLVIPQIWVIPVLFLRCRRGCLEQWKYLKLWLSIIQKCMLVGDLRTRASAYHAWNQFVWAVDPDLTTTDTVKSLVLRPILLGLERNAKDRVSAKARIIYLNSYCNLLYYSLRPGSTFDHLDTYWVRYAGPVLEKMALQGTKEAGRACCILASLFRTNKSYNWDENRANESRRFHIDELPQLEPRWVRSRMKSISKTVLICFKRASWTADADVSPPLQRMWSALMEALAEAGSKEINASTESKDALAQIMNLLHELWDIVTSLCDTQDSPDSRISYISFLAETSIGILKPAHFLSPNLLQSQDGSYTAASSFSKNLRTARSQQAPITEILSWLHISLIEGNDVFNESLVSSAKDILQACCDSQASRRILISRLLQFVHLPKRNHHPSLSNTFAEAIWLMLIDFIQTADDAGSELAVHCSESDSGNSTAFLQSVQSALRFRNPVTVKGIQDIFKCYSDHIKSVSGDDGLIVAIVEPLAAILLEEDPTINVEIKLNLCNNLLKLNSHPHNRKSIEKAAQLLDISYIRQKRSQFDPYESFSTLITQVLKTTFNLSDQLGIESFKYFLDHLSSFINSLPLSQVAIQLRKVQSGLVLWIENPKVELKATSEQYPGLMQLVNELWSQILSSLQRIPKKNSMLLTAVDDLIAAGFSSSCEVIVDQTVEFWNSSFGSEESLEYPDKVLKCLSILRKKKWMSLPHFPLDFEDESNASFQDPSYHTTKEEAMVSTEAAPPVPTAPAQKAETNSMESPQAWSRKGSDTSNTMKPSVEQNSSATNDNEDLLSQQSQLDSQLLTENQGDAGKHTFEELDPEEPAGASSAAELFEEPSIDLSKPESPKEKNAASGYSPRIARGTFFREFNRLNERINGDNSQQSSAEAEDVAINEGLTETTPQENEDNLKGSIRSISSRIETNASGRVVTPLCIDGADGTIATSIEKENSSEGRFLIERSIFVSSTPPSSDIDTVMIADSLLLPSMDNHTAAGRERFSTPLESVGVVDSSSAEDASTPWQAYLNSSPPTSVGDDGISIMVRKEADSMHDTDSPSRTDVHRSQSPTNSHAMQGSAQRFPGPVVTDMEHGGSEKAAQNEGSYTSVSEDLPENTGVIIGESSTLDEHAISASKSMTGSHKDQESPTRKRNLDIAQSEEIRKRLRQDDLSAVHFESDTAQLDLVRSAPVDVYQKEKDETNPALTEKESPITTIIGAQRKSRDADTSSEDPSCNQNSSPVNPNTAGTDILNAQGEESSSSLESNNMLKRRRSRRFEIDIEHVQLTTPKRRKRSATEGSTEHIRIPNVEQKSGSPCSRAAQMQPAEHENENFEDQDIIVDHSEAAISDRVNDSIQNVNRRTDRSTQETNTSIYVEPKANSDDHATKISLPKVASPISPSRSLTPLSSHSSPSRAKAKPASIMGRLRRVLSDCKQLVLGSQEEREFDDVLFEVRREVHEAGRRGRNGSG